MSGDAASDARRALVVGLGLIGSSIGAALRKAGWYVEGDDDDDVERVALEMGSIDSVRGNGRHDLAVVATPVDVVVRVAHEVLEVADVVTDVGSIKAAIVSSITSERFIGGHPMAGSENSGPRASSPDLFDGATWVLTPSKTTAGTTYETVRNAVEEIGAHVFTMEAPDHDAVTASVSHVPHLTASALMNAANNRMSQLSSTQRIAARGFRDMTRIAAGDPDLWTGISIANADAITTELDGLITQLDDIRTALRNRDGERLHETLTVAADARRTMPARVGRPDRLTVLTVTIPDRPGALLSVVNVLGEIDVNLEDFSVVHDESASQGRLEISVASDVATMAMSALSTHGLQVAVEEPWT